MAPDGRAVPLWGAAFAADPDRFYQQTRKQFGPLVPVTLADDVPVTLVTGYGKALEVLRDEFYSADPRVWQKGVPGECPVRPGLEWRPTAARSSGADHDRYRRVVVDVLSGVNLHMVQAQVERVAVGLINLFCDRGQADLRSEYGVPLVYTALGQIAGVPEDANAQLYQAVTEHLTADDAQVAVQGYDLATAVLAEVVRQKKAAPAEDIATWLMQHPAGLTDDEVVHQLAEFYLSGAEPTVSLLVNTLRLFLTDDRFTGDVLGGALGAREAVEETLFLDPPVANGCVRYPTAPRLDGVWLPAHQPVVIGIRAANADPAIQAAERHGNRAHLAWGAGAHQCPSSVLALLIATTGLEQLLDALPVMKLAIPAEQLSWFPTPFLRALSALPATFLPAPPLHLS
ncbi:MULTISPECIES: cytochrome P450 [Nocardia]|uniref:Cytochrome P450 n=3 Tax=Nocardia TaxID=1817 RepID=A0A846XHM9_9NOCA|nr:MULTISPECIES: cytochrome P450 [Nocardia]MBF6456026.1 cytochrome P450 [Nocardia cyriacigeorgica]MBF6553233.1 cytochrome P450 [Nocardia cyriacigeorgica]NKY34855.1 cytochrome P450 [Nocardia speluncae]TLF77685.1 cytochrome P450 [Nocardia cyriacigeorgica]